MRLRGTSIGRHWRVVLLGGLLALAGAEVAAQPAACARQEFETVVDDAAAALRDLNQKNRPAFQDKLRMLKEQRGWSQEQFMAEASAYVQDDRIVEFDQTSGDLLAKLNSTGEAGAATPDCNLLNELRATMKALVETQTSKWVYMFGKIDAALTK
jgi:hypothetical protein